MKIINSNIEDIDLIMDIYSIARTYMKENNNPNQWFNNRPSINLIKKNILDKNHYSIIHNNEIIGVFSFIIGKDKTYEIIEGKWLSDLKYGTIHSLASNQKHKGIFKIILDFCFSKINNIRIDTHIDNKTMLHLLDKYGFTKCGIIYVDDNSPRIAFQKII